MSGVGCGRPIGRCRQQSSVIAMSDQLNPGQFEKLASTAAPFGALYRYVIRLSWLTALASGLITFSLIRRWYIRLPSAVLAFWLSQALNATSWAVIRGALFWSPQPGDDKRHARLHKLAIFVVLVSSAIGIAAFRFVPNWTDFDFNGHPSLVAVAGSLVIGLVALFWAFGLTAWVLFSISVRLVGLSRREPKAT